uniref:YccT family protein n=1 Tax=Thaumasiovibrio occultus TaxID=1891184 RepID=UPI000B35520D|nr:DUF2057 domain-containing protein [Thaumasiovibrio occultus]
MYSSFFRYSTLVTLLCSASSALADVTINLPASAKVLLVNEQVVDDSQKITLKDGSNQVVFRAAVTVRNNGEDTYYESPAHIVTFTAHDQVVDLVLPTLRTSADTRDFSRNPDINITGADGKSIAFTTDTLEKSGFQWGRDFEVEIERYNASNAKAAWHPSSKPVIALTVGSIEGANATDPNVTPEIAESMLHYWYSQASSETQQRFKQYLLEQE